MVIIGEAGTLHPAALLTIHNAGAATFDEDASAHDSVLVLSIGPAVAGNTSTVTDDKVGVLLTRKRSST